MGREQTLAWKCCALQELLRRKTRSAIRKIRKVNAIINKNESAKGMVMN